MFNSAAAVCQANIQGDAHAATAEVSAFRGGAGRALVAEDDAELLTLIVGCLQADGYQVEAMSSGSALCQRLASSEEPPADILISDVRMPGATGIDAVIQVRRAGWTFPVILLTGFGDEALLDEAADRGATLVLCKPFEMDQLCFAVQSLCPKHREVHAWSRAEESSPPQALDPPTGCRQRLLPF